MEKKILIFTLFCAFLLLPFISAESIASYKVPLTIPVNQGITATGLYIPDSNVYANKLCSFYFLDQSGNLVQRADDQFTDATGRFAMPPYVLQEPLFNRDSNYSLQTVCGTATAIQSFVVGQKQEAVDIFGWKFYPQSLGFDLVYWVNSENSMTVLFGLFCLALIIFLVGRYLRTVGLI